MSIAEAGGTISLQGGHVVIFPFPASGHIAPFTPFARNLASGGVAITFLYPKHELHKVKSLVEDESFDARGNVRLVSFEVPLEGCSSTTAFDALKLFMYANVAEFDGIVGRLMSDESRTIQYPIQCRAGPPLCIVSDMFLGFTQGMAEKFNIPRYCLFSCAVHFLSLVFHLPKFNAEGLIPVNRDSSSPLKLPNFPPIPAGDLPPSQHADRGSPNAYLFLLNEAEQLSKAAGVLVNSVGELEHAALEGLQHCFPDLFPGRKLEVFWNICLCLYREMWSSDAEVERAELRMTLGMALGYFFQPPELPKILTVGPLVEGLVGDAAKTSSSSLRQKLQETTPSEGTSACFDWLNQQPDCSVLYLCFGSVAVVSSSQIREMAIALENSQQRFFWVVRFQQDLFPEGFLERTKSQGLVYFDWAPQLCILAHKAVRGFVSHCGWNSINESILVGVPMIAWPFQADQMLNSTLLDPLLGIAIRINKAGAIFEEEISSATFERAIRSLMVVESAAGEAMRTKMLQITDMFEQAVRPGGSSWTNMQTFVQDVRGLYNTSPKSE